jgi:hypothetical protein
MVELGKETRKAQTEKIRAETIMLMMNPGNISRNETEPKGAPNPCAFWFWAFESGN